DENLSGARANGRIECRCLSAGVVALDDANSRIDVAELSGTRLFVYCVEANDDVELFSVVRRAEQVGDACANVIGGSSRRENDGHRWIVCLCAADVGASQRGEHEHDARIADPDEDETREGRNGKRAHVGRLKDSSDTLEKVDSDVV